MYVASRSTNTFCSVTQAQQQAILSCSQPLDAKAIPVRTGEYYQSQRNVAIELIKKALDVGALPQPYLSSFEKLHLVILQPVSARLQHQTINRLSKFIDTTLTANALVENKRVWNYESLKDPYSDIQLKSFLCTL